MSFFHIQKWVIKFANAMLIQLVDYYIILLTLIRLSCIYSSQMQSILYHNSSGNLAFTGNLKKHEVHHAITLHPVKDHKHMFRIHAYLKNLKLQDLKLSSLSFHQDILTASKQLRVNSNDLSDYHISEYVPLYPNKYPPNYLGDTSILGVPPNLNRYHPREVKDVLQWSFLSKVIFSSDNANPKRRMDISTVESIEDNIRELMEFLNIFSKQRGRIIEFREIFYGYYRLDPIHGADYMLDVLLNYKKYRGKKNTSPVRRHVYMQQTFTGIEARELPLGESPTVKRHLNNQNNYDTDFEEVMDNNIPFLNFKKLNIPLRDAFQSSLMKLGKNLPGVFRFYDDESSSKTIHFILPLSGRFDTFVRFLRNYEQVCIEVDKHTSLIVVLNRDPSHPEDFEKTLSVIKDISQRRPNSEISVVKMDNYEFSRGRSLGRGAERCKNNNLLLFIDVDISFNAESLQRVRLNTVEHYRVYFPIVFSEYDPNIVNSKNYNVIRFNNSMGGLTLGDHVHVKMYSERSDEYYAYNLFNSNNRGYYRQFGFGIVSVYKGDFLSVGGFDVDIKGWGLEDVHLYDKFVRSNVSVFRTTDPSLVHVFHPVDCDKNLDVAQYNMCVGTRTNTLGSSKHMTIFLINYQSALDEMPKNVP